MKIVSWNCNGKFREKFNLIQKLDADIYVIQECENPKKYTFLNNNFWKGHSNNKGLGIFAKDNIKLSLNNWTEYCLREFMSVNVNDSFNLLGVWACEPYIAEYYLYQCINIEKYDKNMIIIGDFNSNKRWDKTNKGRNHSKVEEELNNIGLISAYHYVYNEKQAEETQNTFYLQRNINKGFHIDHCFVDLNRIKNYTVLDDEYWLEFSDHMPIILEV